MRSLRRTIGLPAVAALALMAAPAGAQPVGSAFTYQGRLTDAGNPASGTYDLQFVLWDAALGGSQVGSTLTRDDVVVTNGLFTTSLDFGPVFAGSRHWLELGVRPGASTGAYTTLAGRQELTPTPNAAFSLAVPWAGVSGKPAVFADDVDDDSGGDITEVSAGTGLSGGGSSGAVGLAVDPATVQLRVTGACPPGSSVRAVNQDGTVSCQVDADTGVNAVTNGGGITGSVAGRTLTLGSDTTVQRRTVAPTCAVGQYVRSIAADGTPVCVTDANSGGTVTTVGTGPGLTGGPITGSGSVAVATGGIASAMIADGAVTSAKIANGAVGAAQINPSQVQARITATCPVGRYLRAVNTDGTVVCESLGTPPNIITTVDDPPANQGGYASSIAIGADGLPVISYRDDPQLALRVAKCVNPMCSGSTIRTTVVAAASTPFTALAVPPDGLPVIAYQNSSTASLWVAKCGNAACNAGNVITPVDDPPANSVGSQPAIAIGTDGLPIVSYWDVTAMSLKVVKCGNAACSAFNVITTVDDPAGSLTGDASSIAIAPDGLPVISYRAITSDFQTSSLRVAKCGNADCSAGNTLTTVDGPSSDFPGQYTSIAIGADGLPIVSYQVEGPQALKVVKCGNAACNAGNTITTVDDPANFVGYYTSIAIGADGLPIVSHQDSSAGALKVVKCGSPDCATGNTLVTVDDPANLVGEDTSIAIGADGLPVISYRDVTAGSLKVTRCATQTCQ